MSILSASKSGSLDSNRSSSLKENPLEKTLCILKRRLFSMSFYKVSLGLIDQISVSKSDSFSIFILRPNNIMHNQFISILFMFIS